jgi:hypothetical protein
MPSAIRISLVLLACATLSVPLEAVDVKRVPFWDGETSVVPDGPLLNRFGGPVVHQGGTRTSVSRAAEALRTGQAGYRVGLDGTVTDYAFFQLALTGFAPFSVMSRDLARFEALSFWTRNLTGAPFTLKVEIKDDRDSGDHMMYQRLAVAGAAAWREATLSLRDLSGWVVVGEPDLQRARFIGFVFEAQPNLPLAGAIDFDDVQLVEPGPPLDTETAPLEVLVEQVARRQFDGLWGSRSARHGLVPLNSVYGDVAALNSTAALVKLLPIAEQRGWVGHQEASDYVALLLGTLQRLRNRAQYLPARYVDWVNLEPWPLREGEESPVDTAFLVLALVQYKGTLGVSPLHGAIDSFLKRLNFVPFAGKGGWRLAYKYETGDFTPGSYDGYSGEVWTISLAAHLASGVPIETCYHTARLRTRASCAGGSPAPVVHVNASFRAPFLQWLFPLFVKLDGFPADTYPDRALATNPLANAVLYQRDVHQHLSAVGRTLLLQADAGDDGSGARYEQFSCHDSFGQPDLFMPWSATFSLLADADAGGAALRHHLARGLHGPLGLADSAHWPTEAGGPSRITARHDFWNLSLSTMAMTVFLFQDHALLTNLPEVQEALSRVFH